MAISPDNIEFLFAGEKPFYDAIPYKFYRDWPWFPSRIFQLVLDLFLNVSLIKLLLHYQCIQFY